MALLRPFIAFSLALMIALTSGAMAIARGQSGAAGSIVLCTGTGPISVLVDGDGQPIGPVHICPDCALSLFAAVASERPSLCLPLVAFAATPPPPPATATPFQLPRRPRARAPPRV